ncbi:MAG TPA: lipoprotein [Candidatus Methylomirabilis sp.]|nr:lipoprotein [Candidatus Methylomirabilis sp.]
MMPRHRPSLLVAWLILPGMLLAACGRKGPPVPPRPAAPAAVSTIRAETADRAILVTWVRPTRNEDRSPLTDLSEFRLFRAVSPAGPRAPAGPLAFSLLAAVRADQPDNATVQGDLFAFRDGGGSAGLLPGTRYTYRLQAVNRKGTAGPPSVEVSVDFLLAPPPPTGLTAMAGDGLVDLAWQAPALPGSPGSAPPRGYNVYRVGPPGRSGGEPLNGSPITETRFRDGGVVNDATYTYVVRSVAGDRPPWRESQDSNAVLATPTDFTPPGPPRGLVAVPGPGGIALSWEPNAEPDLSGYIVYRREPPALTSIRLSETPIPTTTYLDRAAQPGRGYAYTVTAVDRSPHRNESAASAEVSATLP